MYFLSLDIFHIILTSLFLLMALGVIFFRYKKQVSTNKKTLNYTSDKKLSIARIVSLILSIVLLGVTILEPMGLMKDTSGNTEEIDCVWLLDVSASMDTEDVIENTATISRLARAKSVIENYIIAHPENRYGLVIFAGKSRLVSPLTSEHSSLLSFLASIDSKSIREGGTDFRDALTLATERFEDKDHTPHTIVLLSDGGDKEDAPDMGSIRGIFQGNYTNSYPGTVQKRSNSGANRAPEWAVRLYGEWGSGDLSSKNEFLHSSLITIGIGQTKPSPIPVGHNPLGDTVYKKFQGETVLSGLNRQTLKSLAEAGNGSFLEGDSPQKDLEKSLSSISHRTLQGSWESATDASVRTLVAASLIFLLIFILLPSSFLKRWNAL